jgi:hypothetical protein
MYYYAKVRKTLLSRSLLCRLLVFVLVSSAVFGLGHAPTPAHAQDEFFNTVTYFGNRESLQDTAWGDVDGDGDLDLAVANHQAANQLYLNVGGTMVLSEGILAPPPSPVENRSDTVAWGDVDGDGDLDLAVGNYQRPNQLYLNQDGRLVLSSWAPAAGITWSLAWGDVDGDGDLDLAVGNYMAANQLYLNVGGSLILSSWAPSPLDTRSLAWGDVDGDGDLDLAVGSYRAPNQLYLNESGSLTLSSWAPPAMLTKSVAWGDVDGDGDLDLAVGNAGTNQLYLNISGTLTLSSWVPHWNDTSSIAWGDADGDGDLDLAVGNGGSPNQLYLNQGGSLILSSWAPNLTLSERVAWVDVDNDGNLELSSAGATGHQLYRSSKRLSLSSWAPSPADTRSLAWGDVDGDGDLDLAIGNYSDANQLYLNEGGSLILSSWAPAATTTRSLAWGDVDGDGDLDLAVGNLLSTSQLYLNEGGSLILSSWAPETMYTTSVAWGDVDGDGDLDLFVGSMGRPNQLYLNTNGILSLYLQLNSKGAESIVWGDVDGDGDLDLAVGNNGLPNQLFLNTNGMLTLSDWTPVRNNTRSVAWGDVDGDGDLDLAVGNDSVPNQLYLNESGSLTLSNWSPHAMLTRSVAWGDVDGDGDLDLAVGNDGTPNQLYINTNGNLSLSAWAPIQDHTYSVAWGDADGDGDLDLALGNDSDGDAWNGSDEANRLYLNNVHSARLLPNDPPTIKVSQPQTIAAANFFSMSQPLTSTLISLPYTLFDAEGDPVRSVIGSYSLDGGGSWRPAQAAAPLLTDTLGMALTLDGVNDYVDVANAGSLNVAGELTLEAWVNLNDPSLEQTIAGKLSGQRGYLLGVKNNQLFAEIRDTQGTSYTIQAGAIAANEWTHLAITWQADGQMVGYINGSVVGTQAAGADPIGANTTAFRMGSAPWDASSMHMAGSLDNLRLYSRALSEAELRATMRRAVGNTTNGLVGSWRFNERQGSMAYDQTAFTNTGTLINGPTRSKARLTHFYQWDTFASGFSGQSDDVVFRLQVFPNLYPQPHGTAGPYQYPSNSSQTFPFRVRGTQVRVLNGTQPAADALVYRLPSGQPSGGALISDAAGGALRTDTYGYLRGRGEIRTGDRLLALAPISSTDRYTLYATNGTPVSIGVESFGVADPGVQTLAVSAAHPLLLFDIDLSLEWDAHTDPSYLQQLAFDLKQTSRHLYDFTNGQVALGRVTVHQNADDWAYSDVVVHATNRLRPFAAQGGIVSAATVDPQHPEIVYDTGQVHMGASWNRYGIPGQSLGDDWSIILAHELSHYLLFQDDSYLGINPEGLLIPLGDCSGSAMGDVYTVDNTEFIFDNAFWQAHCADTLPNRSLGRNEWETIQLWYPGLVVPTTINDGPTVMPFDLTTVSAQSPITPTNTLEDQTFTLDYAGGVSSSSVGRALLLRDDYVLDLGSPYGGQNRVVARGARPGDRLCVFDQPRGQYGCEIIAFGDNRLALEQDSSWAPVIQISPVTSQTLQLAVAGVPNGLSLKARLLPEYGRTGATISLSASGTGYAGTFSLAEPSMTGHVQVWVDEAALETNPRRETIEAYTISGNPGLSRGGGGLSRGGGGLSRGGGGLSRGGGGLSRGGGAPLVSPDGQMIFFTANPAVFEVGDFYSVQGMAGLPPLPAEKVAIGAGYNLVASANAPLLTGSISFQYLGNDVLVEGANENELAIHYWDGQKWEVLPTVRDTYDNMASAPSRGPGMYALLAGVSKPSISSVTPSTATNSMPAPLAISGSGFLGPVHVVLVGATTSYTLPVTAMSPTMVTTVVTPGLQVDDYTVRVVNGDGGMATASAALGLYTPADARFYDFFESGAHKWTLDGAWAIATLPGGEQAITDSPAGNYDSAISPATTRRSTITSQPFSLDGLTNPVLSFRHDYVLANVGASVDVGRVEISGDGGTTWTPVASYRGGGIYGPQTQAQAINAPEWATVNWKDVALDLSHYSGAVQIRFSLEVDQTAADKGWLIDDVLVRAGSIPSSHDYSVYLPMLIR